MYIKTRPNSGFTLIELLLVVVLLSLLSLSTTRVVSSIRYASHDAVEATRALRISETIFTHLQNTLSARATIGLPSMNSAQGTASAPSFTQQFIELSESSSQSAGINGKTLRYATQGSRFSNLLGNQYIGDVDARYYVNDNKELIFELHSIPTNPQSNRGNSNNKEPLVKRVLARGIEGFSIRFKTPTGWSNASNSVYGFSPKLLEASISISQASGDQPSIFRTAFRIDKGLR